MEELIGQDIDILLNTKKSPITPAAKSIAFSDQVIADFKKGELIKVTNQNNQIYWVLGGAALLTIIGGSYYYYRKNKKETEKSLVKQKQEIDKLKSDFHNFFDEAKHNKAIRPVKMIRKKRVNINPYLQP